MLVRKFVEFYNNSEGKVEPRITVLVNTRHLHETAKKRRVDPEWILLELTLPFFKCVDSGCYQLMVAVLDCLSFRGYKWVTCFSSDKEIPTMASLVLPLIACCNSIDINGYVAGCIQEIKEIYWKFLELKGKLEDTFLCKPV